MSKEASQSRFPQGFSAEGCIIIFLHVFSCVTHVLSTIISHGFDHYRQICTTDPGQKLMSTGSDPVVAVHYSTVCRRAANTTGSYRLSSGGSVVLCCGPIITRQYTVNSSEARARDREGEGGREKEREACRNRAGELGRIGSSCG